MKTLSIADTIRQVAELTPDHIHTEDSRHSGVNLYVDMENSILDILGESLVRMGVPADHINLVQFTHPESSNAVVPRTLLSRLNKTVSADDLEFITKVVEYQDEGLPWGACVEAAAY